jgi:hypothetical protein
MPKIHWNQSAGQYKIYEEQINLLHRVVSRWHCQVQFANRRLDSILRGPRKSKSRHFPMLTIDLIFQGPGHTIPKKSVLELLNHHRDLLDAKSYAVQSLVPAHVFEAFADALKTQTEISVTKENALSLSLLAKEFFLSELASECATLSILHLHDRACDLEQQISRFSNEPPRLAERIESQELILENLRREIEKVQRQSASRRRP